MPVFPVVLAPHLLICIHIFVLFLSEQTVMMYEIQPDGILKSICTIMVEASPWNLAFDNSYHLWICQPNEKNPVVCYKWNEIYNSVSNCMK